jgi:hypothetical protein
VGDSRVYSSVDKPAWPMAALRRQFSLVVPIGLVAILLLACLPPGQALADEPVVVTVPGPQTIVEDTPEFFSTVDGNAISVADATATGGTMQIVATSGRLSLRSTANVTVTGNGTAAVTLSGLLTNLNAALEDLTFNPVPDSTDTVTLTVAFSDPDGQQATNSVTIAIIPFNDPPVNTVPLAQTMPEDTAKVFSVGSGNPISVNDLDAGTADIQVTLSSSNGGTLTLAETSGLSFTSGANGAASMTFKGTQANINAALNGLSFTPASNYVGPVSLTVVTNDLGNTGLGGAQSDTDTVAINVTPVNDPPVNTVPGAQTTLENTAKVFSASVGNAISVTDPDVGTGQIQVTLSMTNGTVTLGGTSGLIFSTGDGTNDVTVTFRGMLPDINAALNGQVVTPAPNYVGPMILTVVTSDLGNTGAGGPRTDIDTVTITVTARNDPPPTASPTQTPPANGNGWNSGDVTVNWNWAGTSSDGIDLSNCTASSTSSGEGAQTLTATCKDLAGNLGSASYPVRVDKTKPTISAAASASPNANGWYKADVTVQFACTDPNGANGSSGSGIPNGTCPAAQTLSAEGIAVASSAQTGADAAGNTSDSSNVVTVNLDKTAPVVAVTGVRDGASYTLGSVPAAACTTSDALSGVATQATPSVTGGGSVGLGSFTAICGGGTDRAGNGGSASVSYTVVYPWSGFLQPVDNQPTVNSMKAGSAVPVRFSLGGDRGPSIFASGFPTSQPADCDSGAVNDAIEQTVTTSTSGLSYDATSRQYVYVWKTDKAWARTCRQLILRLTDGSEHRATFRFS